MFCLQNNEGGRRNPERPGFCAAKMAPEKIVLFQLDYRMKDVQIVYENEEILIINKEAGVSVQGGAGIVHPLDEELSRQLGYRIFLVHRLDRETSGLMVVAKSAAAAGRWSGLIAGKQVKKEYTAVCLGLPSVKGKTSYRGVLTDSVVKQGRELSALTEFEVLHSSEVEIPSGGEEESGSEKILLSVLRLKLGTGRMHQIRIHLAKAGCPIVQDDRHGNFKLNKKLRKLGLKKLCLAATRLELPLGEKNGKKTVFTVELPEHIKKAAELCGWNFE